MQMIVVILNVLVLFVVFVEYLLSDNLHARRLRFPRSLGHNISYSARNIYHCLCISINQQQPWRTV